MNKNTLSLSVREPKNTLKFTKMSMLNHMGNSETLLTTQMPILTTYVFIPIKCYTQSTECCRPRANLAATRSKKGKVN